MTTRSKLWLAASVTLAAVTYVLLAWWSGDPEAEVLVACLLGGAIGLMLGRALVFPDL